LEVRVHEAGDGSHIPDLSRTVESFASDSNTEVESQVLGTYGVGIDAYKQFIQVCVLVRNRDAVERFEQSF